MSSVHFSLVPNAIGVISSSCWNVAWIGFLRSIGATRKLGPPLTSNIPGTLASASPLSLLGHCTFLLLPSHHVLSTIDQLFFFGYSIEFFYNLERFFSPRPMFTTICISKISCVFPTRHTCIHYRKTDLWWLQCSLPSVISRGTRQIRTLPSV
jgi:hypothetical protein